MLHEVSLKTFPFLPIKISDDIGGATVLFNFDTRSLLAARRGNELFFSHFKNIITRVSIDELCYM